MEKKFIKIGAISLSMGSLIRRVVLCAVAVVLAVVIGVGNFFLDRYALIIHRVFAETPRPRAPKRVRAT